MHRTTFQATGICFFFVVNRSEALPCAWLGEWTADNPVTSALLLPLAPVGVALGHYLHVRVDDDLFYRVVYAGLLVIGVKLLYDVSLAARHGAQPCRTSTSPSPSSPR